MGREIKVSLCQIEVVAGDREGNLGRISDALRLAVAAGVDLAVFPESCILGWINPEAHEAAHPIPGGDSDRLCEMARAAGTAMVIGIDEKEGDDLYGAAIAISAKGELLAKHRKANVLSELMDPPYTEGPAHMVTVTTFPFGRVAIVICADSFVEETRVGLAEAKADLIAVPYGWVATNDTWPQHGDKLRELVCGLAREVGAPMVGVDAVGEVAAGPWKSRRFCGATLAADLDGKPLTEPRYKVPFVATIQMGS